MTERQDWLVGTNRNSAATDRILTVATNLLSKKGVEEFTIAALAERVHCSPATIYRQVGGKAVILERVIDRASQAVLGTVRQAIEGLAGPERVVTAIAVTLKSVRAQPVADLMMGAIRPDGDRGWVTASPLVAELAEEMLGRSDPLAGQYLVRVTFALWYWPVQDPDAEYEMIRRFIGPSFF